MGNTWAMTRGLATPEQSRQIVDEYRRRHGETGDAYPWWSLQPGYPDELGYFSRPYCKQGGYANGGLMPWVGGELCRGALLHAAASATAWNCCGSMPTTCAAPAAPRSGTGPTASRASAPPTKSPTPAGAWPSGVSALVEGLAGIRDQSGQMRRVELAPRWAATPLREARVTARYAASQAYFAYRWRMDEADGTIRLTYSGSGEQADFRVLLPEGCEPVTVSVPGEAGPVRSGPRGPEPLRRSSRRRSRRLGEVIVTCRRSAAK